MKIYQNYYAKIGGEWKLLIVGIDGNKDIIEVGEVESVAAFLADRWISEGRIEVTEIAIDEADIAKLKKIQWLVASTGYVRGMASDQRKNVFLHRYLMDAPTGMVVDHINGNILDNRRRNLRIATYTQNAHNKPSRNIRQLENGSYNVYFTIDGRQRSFGTFDTLEEAESRRAEVKEQLAFGTLTEKPERQSSTGERYVKRSGNRFMVVIPFNGERRYVGTYDSIEEAARARDAETGNR